MNDDLISRQAVIKKILYCENHDMEHDFEFNEGLIAAINAVKELPTADLSEYCDKLWKTAYERGKQEARPIRCDECKYWNIEWIPDTGVGHYCPMMDHIMVGDEWCCYGERRESDG